MDKLKEGIVYLLDPVQNILLRVGDFFMYLFGAIVILALGWLIARFISGLVTKALKGVKVDVFAEKYGIAECLVKGEIKQTLSEIIGAIVYWILILVTLMVVANALGLDYMAGLLERVISCVPNVLVAVVVLVVGILVSGFVKGLVQTSAKNAGIGYASGLAKTVQVIIVVFSILVALEQLKIGTSILYSCLNIILASIGLAIGLAFGLGGKDIAAKILSDFKDKYCKCK